VFVLLTYFNVLPASGCFQRLEALMLPGSIGVQFNQLFQLTKNRTAERHNDKNRDKSKCIERHRRVDVSVNIAIISMSKDVLQ